MSDFQILQKRNRNDILFLLAAEILAWGILPWRAFVGGILLGTAVSFLNLWLLSRRTALLMEAVRSGRKVYTLGTMPRMALSCIAISIPINRPDLFSLPATVLGLAISYFMIISDALVRPLTARMKEEER